MIYGYIRVSTDKQTVENQRFEINQFCKNQEMVVDKWIEETISGQECGRTPARQAPQAHEKG